MLGSSILCSRPRRWGWDSCSELRYIRLNDALARMNGVPREAHLGRTVRELLPHHADLIEPLRASGLPVYPVGDCVAPRRVEHAVHEAHAVARGL